MQVEATPPIPPQDLDSERALLGGLLTASRFDPHLTDADLDEIRSIVGPEAFYLGVHRRIFQAIVDTHDAGGPPDGVAILGRLKASEPGIDWPDELRRVDIQGDSANCSYYARAVRDCWRKRSVIRAATEAIERAYDPLTSADEVLASLAKRLDQIEQRGLGDREARPEADLLRTIENPRHTTSDRVPVALGRLGYLLDGGLEPGSLTILGARPSCGKTSLLLGLCTHAARASEGCSSLFVSLEMSAGQIGLRLLSMRSGLAVHAIRAGQIEEDRFRTERGRAALEAESGFPIYVLDGITDARQIVAHAKRYVRKFGIKLVLVDYIGLCSLAGRFDRHDLKIAALSALFKGLARDTGAAVVLASQLSRASDKEGRRPKLSDLRDSGSLEQDADVVLLIHRGDDDSGPLADTTIIVAKQRQGGTGTALVCYDKRTMCYQARHVGPEPWSVAAAEGPE